jgi:hypothetical protein
VQITVGSSWTALRRLIRNAWKIHIRDTDGTGEHSSRLPYAVLQQPQPTRAYRFVYPTLLLASSIRRILDSLSCGTQTILIFTRVPVKKGESALVAFFPGDNVELDENRCSLAWDEEIELDTITAQQIRNR